MTTLAERHTAQIIRDYGSRERWLECMLEDGREARGLHCGSLCVSAHTEIKRLDDALDAKDREIEGMRKLYGGKSEQYVAERKECDRLRARVAELEEALRPFAALVKPNDRRSDEVTHDLAWSYGEDDDRWRTYGQITLGDLRRAQSALTREEKT